MFAAAFPTADADAALVARIVTPEGVGAIAGAVNNPAVEIEPIVELPPVMPFTLQITEVFDVFATVAVNSCVAEGASVTDAGATVTVTVGGGGV